ncbi:T4 RnlA family RNA ligase [Runella sp.]|uniref:T4 RnlA family RNA ligase n=1 Tax=Runella sp. TaxID=1960881 RepID=UPI003D1101EC
MNISTLQQLIADDYIKVQKHPTAPLYIYNYTPKTQYDRVWNELTLACRGLILDEQYNIVARPFGKFFNLGEMENQVIPNEPFEVFEKLDGSLGILYWYEGKPFIASRGSFSSEQAQVATEMLYTQYAHVIPNLDPTKTYLFEIIYPENRIVVDYGTERKLVLLAVIDTQTGIDAVQASGFEIVKRYDGLNDLHVLKTLEEANKEGFVVRFRNGYRLKVKFDEYQRIHRIVTGVSNVSIWEYLKEGQDLTPILEKVPDEFYDWVKETHTQLLNQFAEIEAICKADFRVLDTRKDTALYFQTCRYPAVLFKMFDQKPYNEVIWKQLRPVFQKPFSKYDV